MNQFLVVLVNLYGLWALNHPMTSLFYPLCGGVGDQMTREQPCVKDLYVDVNGPKLTH